MARHPLVPANAGIQGGISTLVIGGGLRGDERTFARTARLTRYKVATIPTND
jgi:hypothetical protein